MGELGREGPGKEKKGEKSNFLTNPFVKLQMKQKNDGLYMNAAKDCSEIVLRNRVQIHQETLSLVF